MNKIKLRYILYTSLFLLTTQSSYAGFFDDLRNARQLRSQAKSSIINNTRHQQVQITVDGLERSYIVHVPASYRGESTPMAIAFHGGSGNMELQADDEKYGLISKSESSGYILVFPNGYSKFSNGKFATWNAGKCCGAARDKNIDDVGFVRVVIKDVSTKFNVDQKRIFALGMSNGGMMSYRLACEMSDTFKAIASVAGTDETLSCFPSKLVSILHIHAKNDEHILINGGAGKGAFKDYSKITKFTGVPTTINNWVSHNHCKTPSKRILDVPGAYCEVNTGCESDVEVKLCVTDAGGHSWPGGGQVRENKEAPTTAISANDVIWDFFGRN